MYDGSLCSSFCPPLPCVLFSFTKLAIIRRVLVKGSFSFFSVACVGVRLWVYAKLLETDLNVYKIKLKWLWMDL